MRKTRKPRRLLKKLSRPRGGDRRKRGSWQADRVLVSRRGSDREEKQGHPPMGETRDTAFGAARPEDEFSLYFRRHLPGRRKRRRSCPPLLQQRGHGPASRRNLACGRTKRACARSSRSGRVACLGEASRPGQHHALAVAAEIARAQSGREHLAVHARQLALEPRLRILRRHSRSLLLRLEQAHRHALENHLHRNKRVGLWVVISETWYKLWNLCHILRDDGVTYNEYVTELTFLLYRLSMSLMQVEDSAPNLICAQRWKAFEDARGFTAESSEKCKVA